MVIGRTHAALRRNRQDALASGKGEWGAFGVVSDGCGSGLGSELGALLTAATAASFIQKKLEEGDAPDVALRSAWDGVIAALRGVRAMAVRTADEASAFEHGHLLATLLAFAVTPTRAAVIVAGDGFVRVDGDALFTELADAPAYPAFGGAPILHAFDAPRSIAIATDGFDDASLQAISAIGAADLTRHMFVRQRAGAFVDDAAIVVARRSAS
jgi:hypothetical protein